MIWRRRYEVVVLGESGSAISQRSVISEHRTERDAREAASQERRRLEVIRAEEAASWVVMVVRADEVLHEERPFDGRRDAVPVPPVGPLGLIQRDPAATPLADEPADTAEEAPRETPTGAFPAPGTEADADADDEAPADDGVTADAQASEETAPPAQSPHVAGHHGETAPGGGDDEPDAGETGRARRPTPRGVAPAARPGDEDWGIDTFAVEHVPAAQRERPADPAPAGGESAVPAADEAPPTHRRRDDDIPAGRVPDDVIRRFEESIARERARARQRGSRPPER